MVAVLRKHSNASLYTINAQEAKDSSSPTLVTVGGSVRSEMSVIISAF